VVNIRVALYEADTNVVAFFADALLSHSSRLALQLCTKALKKQADDRIVKASFELSNVDLSCYSSLGRLSKPSPYIGWGSLSRLFILFLLSNRTR
jgi:hypothetical protein